MNLQDQPSTGGRFGSNPTLWVVLAGFILTALLWHTSQRLVDSSEEERFSRLVEKRLNELHRRVQSYHDALHGAVGLYAASKSVERGEWKAYVGMLDVQSSYPAVLGFGHAAHLRKGQLDKWLDSTRQDEAPGFALKAPQGTNEILMVTDFMEPLGTQGNAQLVGMDLANNPVTKAAAEDSLRTGEAAISERIELTVEGTLLPGFLYMLPVFRNGTPRATEAQRHENIVGWVFTVMRVDRVVEGIDPELEDQLDLDVFEGNSLNGSRMIFDRDNHLVGSFGVVSTNSYAARQFSSARNFNVGGRNWLVVFSALEAFHAARDRSTPFVVAISGLVISLLLAAVVHSLHTTRDRARRIAKEMTRDLSVAKESTDTSNHLLQSALLAAEQLADEANAANRAKSEFLATMSHEIRTPMNGLLGFTRILLEGELNPDQRSCVEMINRSGEALLALINDILDFSRIEAGRLDLENIPFDLEAVANDAVKLLRSRAVEKGLEIGLTLQPGVACHLRGDPTRLRQVLLNLVGNAIKFTQSGFVRLEISPDPDISSKDASRPGVRVAVIDSGIGIPLDKQAELFKKFSQADSSTTRRFGGSGLGLAISKSLVVAMGGSMGLRSAPGEGSCFWFSLSLERASLPDQVPTKGAPGLRGGLAPAGTNLSTPLRILLVEDTHMNQVLAQRLLKKLGCTADLAHNGREGVERASAGGYDVILMDCHMPEMDGYQAAAAIRRLEQQNPSVRGAAGPVPIIALTASVMEADRERCFASGMNDFVAKPIAFEALRDALQRCTLRIGNGVGQSRQP